MKQLLAILAFVSLVNISAPCFAQELGRLFFTPEQRQALDARRRARLPDRPSAPMVSSPTTRLDGYVKRDNGKSTVFVNGEPVPERVLRFASAQWLRPSVRAFVEQPRPAAP